MKKKKIVFLLLLVSISVSGILFFGQILPFIDINMKAGDRFLTFIITSLLFVYYRSLTRPELMPSIMSSEKDNSKDKQANLPPDVFFDDVAGLEEIKEELQETIDFINNTMKYKSMGAKIPKGILFHGPPGTGKTLLAKAVAGETNSNFIYASGSEFVEKYVGVGAKRVRSLFEKAKKDSPSIIFIDELDAIGTKRNSESNNEKDQTLNQLLVELDGFTSNETVIVIAATNRKDLLDEALLRPGRFDRHIYIGNPNISARERILEVHTKNKPLDSDVSIKEFAQKTTGLSGAQLANIANEAAIIAVRKKKRIISSMDFDAALERVIAGLEIKNPSVLIEEKKIVSIHEAGHALASLILDTDLIQKISIVPRGQALGYVLKFPEEERFLISENELFSKIIGLLAGRAAERFEFKEITTGAKDDLTQATHIAREMVCNYGMSSLGNISLDEVYIRYNYDTVRIEIKKITDSAYEKAQKIIEDHQDLLYSISAYLIEYETIDKNQLKIIYENYKESKEFAYET